MTTLTLWLAARTRRYHTVTTVLREQTVADHSWGVATIIRFLHPEPTVKLMSAALCHDLGETVTGDVPFTIKKQHDLLKHTLDAIEEEHAQQHGYSTGDLTVDEKTWLKAADALEGFMYANMEATAGNRYMQVVADRYYNVIMKSNKTPPQIKAALIAAK